MAQVGELLIALQGDSKSWSSSIDTASKDLRRLVAESQKAGKDLGDFNAKTVNLLKGWKNEVGSAYRALDKSLKPVKQSLVEQGKALNMNQKGMTTLALKTVVAAEASKVFNDNLKSVSNSLWLMSSGLQQFGRSMTMAFTVPVVAATVAATKSFAEWEKGTVSIQRAAEITRREAESITESFIKISQTVPMTVEELQKAGYAAAQAGVTGENAIVNFAKAATMLSRVGGDAFKALPVDDLANKLAKLGIAFGETGENWEKVNNLASSLLVVAKAVPGGLGEIIEAMRRTSGIAVTMGLSLADTAAAMGTLVAAGVPAARAGTEFNRVLLEIAQNSEKVGQALGYTDEKMAEFKERIDTDMMGVLVELIDRYGQIEGKVDKITHLQEIFGKISLKALLPLIDNVDLLRDLMSRANQELESGALITAEFAIEATSLSGTMIVFKNNMLALAETIGKDLAPYISLFLQSTIIGLKNLIASWKELNPHLKFVIFLFAGLTAIIGPLALILNTLFLNPISGLITFITFLSKLNTNLGITAIVSRAASGGVFSLGSVFAGAIPAVAGFTKALGVLLLGLGKILLVVGLVAGAVYLLGKALGINFKFPSMPEIKLPKYAGAGAKGDIGTGDQEALAEADQKAAKAKTKALSREMRDKKKARNKEMKIIDQGVDEYEKVRDAEIKARQKLVDNQRDALDLRKEQWDDEKRLEDEKISIQKESLDTAKATLDAAKKELRKLKKVQDAELQTAENGVDYAELNLKAAQDVLKREKLLGRDEFDASFRATEARVKAWEEAANLARENVIKVKREYDKQISVQEDMVEINEEQVDLQSDALNDLKKALNRRKIIIDKEIDLLDDELNVRRDELKNYKENTQEKLDLLNEAKDVRQDAWDEELLILQDQLDAARDMADDISSMPLLELPDLAATMGQLDEEMQRQIQDMQNTMRESMSFGPGIGEKGLIPDYKNAWEGAKKLAETEGKSAGRIFVEAMWASLVDTVSTTVDEIFGQLVFGENMAEARKMAKEEGRSFSSLIWEGIKEWWANEVDVKQWLIDYYITPIKQMFPIFFQTGKESGEEVDRGLEDGTSETEQTGTSAIQNFIKGLEKYEELKNALSRIKTTISSNLGSISNNAWNWGYNIVDSFREGMESAGKWIGNTAESISNQIKGYWESLSPPKKGPLRNIDTWGENLVKTYTDGMLKAIPYIEKNLGDISGNIGNSFAGMASSSLVGGRTESTVAPAVAPITKNYYIQPGQMIASRGEIRNFVRMLKEYDQFEEGR